MIRIPECPSAEGEFTDIALTVGGKRVMPTACRVSALPFNTPWPGHQRPVSQSEVSGFVRIVADEPVEIEAETHRPFAGAVVRPLSEGVIAERRGRGVCFTLKEEGQYVLEFGDEHTALHIFLDRPRDFSEYGKPTRVFGAGVHDAGKIVVNDGDRIFLEEGAHVYGVLYGKNVHDVAVYGYGVLDGGKEERTSPNCYEDMTNGCLKFYESSHIRIDGVTFIDSAIWVCNLFACTDAVLNDIKVVGHWKYNCDGIDIVNSSDITVKNSFIRAFDDVITLKGILPYRQLPLENILVENCVLWCGLGRTLEIGLETIAEHYKNISFRNCDLIHNSAVAIDIQCGDYAEVRDISYEDIRAEYQAGSLPEQMENPIGCRYEGFGKKNTPVFIKICTQEYTLGHPFEEYDEELLRVRQGRAARVDNIRFENVSALLEEGCEPPQIILDVKEPAFLGKVTMKNVRICSAQEAKK